MPEMTFTPKDDNAIHREVFDVEKIESKTELDPLQVNAVTRMKAFGFLTGNQIVSKYADYFMVLQKSNQRKSMAEFLDSMGRKRENQQLNNKSEIVRQLLG